MLIRTSVSTVVDAAALAMAGCSTEAGTAKPAAQSAEGSSSSTATSTSDSAGSGDYTKQGSKLSLGEKAVVPFKSRNQQGAIGITVTAIEKGDLADFAALKLGDKANGMVPYYVRVTVSNESGTDFSFSSLSSMGGLLADGSEAQRVSLIGSFDKCDSGDGGKGFTTAGATYPTCVLALAPSGASVTGASYSSGSYASQAPNTDYGDEALTWKQSTTRP